MRVQVKASGAAMQLLTDGWPDPNVSGPQPVVWSPAASSWGAILNQRLSDRGEPEMATDAEPFMLTPLVIAMPEPMADALGYPETPIGYADILRLANDPAGWGAFGHPEWGPFRLGKTNPNFSTSALSATIAQYYAATGKTADLSLEDLNRPEVQQFARGVESAVVHYGDITMTFLNNWFRNDVRDTALTYASAVAVEEKSVIDYNKGNPDGVLSPGEEAREPRVPLVAVYPKEGTLYSDNPFIVLDAPWVTDEAREGARAFEEFIKRPEAQRRVLEFGFRPGNVDVPIGEPISAEWGVDANQPQTLLEVPAPEVLTALLDRWAAGPQARRASRCSSTCRARWAIPPIPTVRRHRRSSTSPRPPSSRRSTSSPPTTTSVCGCSRPASARTRTRTGWISSRSGRSPVSGRASRATSTTCSPSTGTPLYTATEDTYDDMIDAFDPTRINAVVLLSDGRNEDPENNDLEGLIRHLRAGSEGENSQPVRVFAIAYGGDADLEIAAPHRRGDQRPGVRRVGRDDHLAGVHRGRQQLLTTMAFEGLPEHLKSRRTADAVMAPSAIVAAGAGASLAILAGAPLLACAARRRGGVRRAGRAAAAAAAAAAEGHRSEGALRAVAAVRARGTPRPPSLRRGRASGALRSGARASRRDRRPHRRRRAGVLAGRSARRRARRRRAVVGLARGRLPARPGPRERRPANRRAQPSRSIERSRRSRPNSRPASGSRRSRPTRAPDSRCWMLASTKPSHVPSSSRCRPATRPTSAGSAPTSISSSTTWRRSAKVSRKRAEPHEAAARRARRLARCSKPCAAGGST